jgi:hypothetical protein
MLVDWEPAGDLLADLLKPGSADSRFALGVDTADDPPPTHRMPRLPDRARLHDLAGQTSTDYAALSFAQAIRAERMNSLLQAAFERFTQDGPERAEEVLRRPGAFPYTVLLVPSWMYRSAPLNGADFARQRRILERLGLPHRTIATAESGDVEDNAVTIAADVREACRRGEAVLLVSASKSGAEVALALARVLTPSEAACVAGWLNIAGALGGSPLADAALRPPASLVVRLAFWLMGWDWQGMVSMATEPRRSRLYKAAMPETVAVLNLVAVPVSGSVGRQVFFGYQMLRSHGPNDGVVLLADTVWPGAPTLAILGTDHLFGALQNDAHDLAMLRAMDLVVRLHGGRRPSRTEVVAE